MCVWRATGRHFNDDDDVLGRGACGPKLTLVNQNVERVEERGGSIFRMRRRKNKRGTEGERCAARRNSRCLLCGRTQVSVGKPTNAAMNGFVYGRKSHHYSSPSLHLGRCRKVNGAKHDGIFLPAHCGRLDSSIGGQ